MKNTKKQNYWFNQFVNLTLFVEDGEDYGKLPYMVFSDSEYGEGELKCHFEYRIIHNKDGQKCDVYEPKDWFDTKQEAYSSAIDYVLNNLI